MTLMGGGQISALTLRAGAGGVKSPRTRWPGASNRIGSTITGTLARRTRRDADDKRVTAIQPAVHNAVDKIEVRGVTWRRA